MPPSPAIPSPRRSSPARTGSGTTRPSGSSTAPGWLHRPTTRSISPCRDRPGVCRPTGSGSSTDAASARGGADAPQLLLVALDDVGRSGRGRGGVEAGRGAGLPLVEEVVAAIELDVDRAKTLPLLVAQSAAVACRRVELLLLARKAVDALEEIEIGHGWSSARAGGLTRYGAEPRRSDRGSTPDPSSVPAACRGQAICADAPGDRDAMPAAASMTSSGVIATRQAGSCVAPHGGISRVPHGLHGRRRERARKRPAGASGATRCEPNGPNRPTTGAPIRAARCSAPLSIPTTTRAVAWTAASAPSGSSCTT